MVSNTFLISLLFLCYPFLVLCLFLVNPVVNNFFLSFFLVKCSLIPFIQRYIVLLLTVSAGLQSTSPGYRLQLLEHSDLAQTLLLSMAALENQPGIRLQLLQLLQILSGSSGQQLNLFWISWGGGGARQTCQSNRLTTFIRWSSCSQEHKSAHFEITTSNQKSDLSVLVLMWRGDQAVLPLVASP